MIYLKSKIRKSQNEYFGLNHKIDSPNDIQIYQFTYEYKAKNQRIRKKPKLSNLTMYLKSNCPHNSTPKFGLKMNSRWSNIKLKGQIVMKFYDLAIPKNLMK